LTALALEPLTQVETEALAEELAGGALSSAGATQLFADTGGNPLFVVETVRAVKDDLVAETVVTGVHAATMLPASVYAIMQTRLARLSPHAQEFAGLAAVIGRAFRYELLATASTRSEDEVVQGLEELWRRRIVQETVGDAYDFSHDRLRDVAYTELSRPRRRLFHRRVAEALQQIQPSTADDLAGQLADHYERAGLADAAVDHYLKAGAQALDNWAAPQAITIFTHAGELASTAEQQARAWLGLARARFLLDQRRAALSDVATALALLDAPDNPLRPQLLYLQADLLAADAKPDAAEESVRAALAIAERIGQSIHQILDRRMRRYDRRFEPHIT
jgi:predicted ATPase